MAPRDEPEVAARKGAQQAETRRALRAHLEAALKTSGAARWDNFIQVPLTKRQIAALLQTIEGS
jgi:hypothetical protein